MPAAVLIAILALGGCAEIPPPVTATKLFAVSGVTEVLNAVALSPDGVLVVVADMDGQIIARDVPSGAERWKVRAPAPGAPRRIDTLAFSGDGTFLVSAGDDARVTELWKADTGYEAGTVAVRNARTAAFHPTERTLVLGGGGTLHVVDVEKGEVTRTIPNAHLGDLIYAAAFSPDGGVLASVSLGGSLKLWQWPALTLRSSVSMSSSLEAMSPRSLALTRDGARVASNGIQGKVHVWDGGAGREERTFTNRPEAPGHWHAELKHSLAFTSDGSWLFAPDTHDQGLRILHLPSGRAYPVLKTDVPFYKAVAIATAASTVALLHAGDGQGKGPYGLEVWQLQYAAK